MVDRERDWMDHRAECPPVSLCPHTPLPTFPASCKTPFRSCWLRSDLKTLWNYTTDDTANSVVTIHQVCDHLGLRATRRIPLTAGSWIVWSAQMLRNMPLPLQQTGPTTFVWITARSDRVSPSSIYLWSPPLLSFFSYNLERIVCTCTLFERSFLTSGLREDTLENNMWDIFFFFLFRSDFYKSFV